MRFQNPKGLLQGFARQWSVTFALTSTSVLLCAGATAGTQSRTPTQAAPATQANSKPSAQIVVVQNLPEAATGQPTLRVQISKGRRVALAKRQTQALTRISTPKGARTPSIKSESTANWFIACLDTGAACHYVDQSTAARFGIVSPDDSDFQRVRGVNGEITMSMSTTYTLSVASNSGEGHADSSIKFTRIQDETLLLVAQANDQGINIIGMPAIRHMVVEIQPSPNSLANPTLRILEPTAILAGVDIEIPLQYMDFGLDLDPQWHAPKPYIKGIVTEFLRSESTRSYFTGQWLLDTGADASIISVKHAKALGLLKHNGTPTRSPDFVAVFSGMERISKQCNGFVIDRIRIPATGGKTLEFRKVPVIVVDVVGGFDRSGQPIVIDGVFGKNLLLPGMSGAGPPFVNQEGEVVVPKKTTSHGAFERIWLNGPRGILALRVRESLSGR